jgi:hypothetical protein
VTDLTIFIASVGPNVFKTNLIETIYSIAKNIGDFDYKFYIVVDDPDIEAFVKQIFDNQQLRQFIKEESLLEIVYTRDSWATDYNEFFEKYKDTTRYILSSHDDIIMHTPNFFGKTLEEIGGHEEEVGWIVYTNNHYYNLPTGPMPNSFGNGFHTDMKNFPFVYECHNFNKGLRLTNENKHLMDFPERAVRCHGPWDFMVVSAQAMKKIGPCAHFGPYTMLIDEDWALESLKNNLINIWVPSVSLTHPNPKNVGRRRLELRFADEAHELFIKKWGFRAHDDYEIAEKREEILEKYKDTNIPWSSARKSYEWDYLKNE